MELKKGETIVVVAVILIVLVMLPGMIKENIGLIKMIRFNKPVKVGERGYLFEETTLGGERVSMEGKKTLLVFFKTHCPSCEKGMSMLREYSERLKKQSVGVVCISNENEAALKGYPPLEKITWDLISDPDMRIIKKYRVKYVICFVYVDQDGIIRYYQQPDEKLEAVFQSVLDLI
jgi:peroxiredoxin